MINNSSELMLMSFTVGNKTMGLPIDEIQEVIEPIATVRVPLTDCAFEGFFMFRGQVTALIDVAQLLGMTDKRASQAEQKYMIVSSGKMPMALHIDRIGETYQLNDEIADNGTENSAAEFISTGQFSIDGQIVDKIDLEKLFTEVKEMNRNRRLQAGYPADDRSLA